MRYMVEPHITTIRVNIINWATYRQSGAISQEDYKTMSSIEKSSESFFNEYTELAVDTSLRLLTTLDSYEDAILSILVLLVDHTSNENSYRLEVVHSCGHKMPKGVFGPFLHLIHNKNPLVMHLAAHLLARIATKGHKRLPETDQIIYYNILKHHLNLTLTIPHEYIQPELHCLQIMLSLDCYRKTFVQIEGIMLLIRLLPRNDFQVQYQTIFCLWVLCFNRAVVMRMHKYTFTPTIMKIIKECQKEKLLRVVLAFFVNLISNCPDSEIQLEYCALLIHCGMPQTLHSTLQHYLEDPEFKESAETLQSLLDNAVDQLCTFSRYAAELRSETLTWTPVHRSTKFWAENAFRLNENNFELLRLLVKYLEFSKESETLAVALQDIGQYVSRYQDGKAVLDSLGGKVLVLQHLSHYDKDVRYEALMTASQLLKIN